jgi:hypothetical protein
MPYVRSTLLILAIASLIICLSSVEFGVLNDGEFVLSQYITREKIRHHAEQNLRHLLDPQELAPSDGVRAR